MISKKININYKLYESIDEIEKKYKSLFISALNAIDNSYSPYSKFKVGAAILLNNGKIVIGSNQENAASPSGLCAERVALFYANSEYPKNAVKAIVVCAMQNNKILEIPITPCGECRQALLETEIRFNSQIEVFMYGSKQIIKVDNIKSLLPFSFNSFYNIP